MRMTSTTPGTTTSTNTSKANSRPAAAKGLNKSGPFIWGPLSCSLLTFEMLFCRVCYASGQPCVGPLHARSEKVRDLLQVLRVFPGVLLILGVFGSLAQGSAVLAAAPPYPCPTTKSQLQADITAVGAGGTVSLSCPAATTIPFTGSPITITQDVTVDASHSPGRITVDGGNTTQLFAVNAGVNFGVISLTLANGLANTNDGATNNNGGAIFSDGNTVTVTDGTFTGNMAANNGGAIGNDA